MSGYVQGPFSVEDMGDWIYVISDDGIRMAECNDDDADARSKAKQISDALNAAHYLACIAISKATAEKAQETNHG